MRSKHYNVHTVHIILETGNIVKEAKASDLLNDPAVREAYLGTGAH
jgi:branched-chain amino acid transport system ATP-binding protein